MTDDSKTPEQMAEEYANWLIDKTKTIRDIADVERPALQVGFLAGYQAAKPQWISVKERLPEIPDNRWMSDDVLWLTRYGEMEVSCLERLHSEFRVDWGDAGLLELDKFTHWMPLPEAPKGEK